MIGDAIAQAMIGALIAVALGAVALTLAVIYGVPWLWGFIKPWLHAITG